VEFISIRYAGISLVEEIKGTILSGADEGGGGASTETDLTVMGFEFSAWIHLDQQRFRCLNWRMPEEKLQDPWS
jgi:hypothetical protein